MVNYKDYELKTTSHKPEAIEWTNIMSYNAPDDNAPRVLLVGDSIVSGYHGIVRDITGNTLNLTHWSSSKSVGSSDYLRLLDYALDCQRFDAVLFNNGLHCLADDVDDYAAHYAAAVDFICAKLPDAKLLLVTSTDVADQRNDTVIKLNREVEKISSKKGLPLLDLYALSSTFPSDYHGDEFHFRQDGKELLAKKVATAVLELMEMDFGGNGVIQRPSETGPDGKID